MNQVNQVYNVQYKIVGMDCPGCARTIETALNLDFAQISQISCFVLGDFLFLSPKNANKPAKTAIFDHQIGSFGTKSRLRQKNMAYLC